MTQPHLIAWRPDGHRADCDAEPGRGCFCEDELAFERGLHVCSWCGEVGCACDVDGGE